MTTAKKCVAVILAGGQGNRLGVLTKYRAKPAVPFGGKYRIIDFALSNCANSGIDTVGVLTQYQPLELNSYIGNGASWDLDSIDGGAFVLPPFVGGKTAGRWYSGTADAVYQNSFFIDRYSPEYLLVLSGDHIYKMDYNAMIKYHRKKGADVTVGALKVPMCDAHRFGIMNVDEEMRICEFQEKPKEPKSDLASMGIYVFSWEKVQSYLSADAGDKSSQNDFGKNILPKMLSSGEKMYAYPFEGYWKDVGTIQSLWEANMELLSSPAPVELQDPDWRIYARNPALPPHFVGEEGAVRNSMVAEGCHIYGSVSRSVLFPGVTVEKGATVEDSIIMANTHIGENARVCRAIVDEDCRVEKGAGVGEKDGEIAVLGRYTQVSAGAQVRSGEQIEPKSQLKERKI